MLTELEISNFAIIDELSVSFGPGLNVITGESGVGKSIILQAIELMLGSRPKKQLLREGADSWEVQALFDLSEMPKKALADLPDIAQGEELSVARSMNSAGKGRVHINGRLSSAAMLEEVASRLINICGQNQHIRLLDAKYHRELIDDFAGLGSVLEDYSSRYSSWRDLKRTLDAGRSQVERNVLRRAELEFVIEELGALNLKANLRTELDDEVRRLGSAQELIEGLASLINDCTSSDGALIGVNQIARQASNLGKLDSGIGALLEPIENAQEALNEFMTRANRYRATLSVDPNRLEDLRSVLSKLASLERKYRRDTAGLMDLLDNSKSELTSIELASDIEKLQAQVASEEAGLTAIAAKITQKRTEAARRLAKEVQSDLAELNMADAKLSVAITPEELGPSGRDRVELMIATQTGATPRAIREIASGGELSRLMLAIKKVLKDSQGVNILVFDEIDTGISGSVARAVGEKLKALSEHSQVICITHLPQVASLADHHFLVGKVGGKKSHATISLLSADQRIDEIARMLAGYTVTDAARESARELMTSKT